MVPLTNIITITTTTLYEKFLILIIEQHGVINVKIFLHKAAVILKRF
jgi:hypothetical protein